VQALRYRFAMPAPDARRLDALDALRGAAMVWMTLFHFSFDLSHFGLLGGQNFYVDAFWTWQRTAIVTLFLFCAGMGQGLAHAQQLGWGRFAQRWWRIAACALAVSAGSWFMFPNSWISFGVLHGMALMLLIVRLLLAARLPGLAWGGLVALLAGACMLLPLVWRHAWFDSRWTNWIGLVTHKPVTEDYVPLLPWLGPMLIGVLVGRVLAQRAIGATPARRAERAAGEAAEGVAEPVPGGGTPAVLRPLVRFGRWPLSYYMLHQPVLIGLLTAWVSLRGH
jgi:uncharacterized membrane protein